jgi:hypothetical protein
MHRQTMAGNLAAKRLRLDPPVAKSPADRVFGDATMAGLVLCFCSLRDLMRLHALSRGTVGWIRWDHRRDVQAMWRRHLDHFDIPLLPLTTPDVCVRRSLMIGQKLRRGETRGLRAHFNVRILVTCKGCPNAFALDRPNSAYDRHQAECFGGWFCSICRKKSRFVLFTTSETTAYYRVTINRLIKLGVRRFHRAGKAYFRRADLARLVSDGKITKR